MEVALSTQSDRCLSRKWASLLGSAEWAPIAALLLLIGLASELTAQNWPMFRGPNASGVAENARPPVNWGETGFDRVLWTTPIPGLGHSSPVVWGDRVFLTSAVSTSGEVTFDPEASSGRTVRGEESEQEWILYCLDRNSGEILWQRVVQRSVPRLRRHDKGSHANETPATNGESIAVFLGSQGLHVFDLEGNHKWSRDLGVIDAGYVGLPEFEWGTASSPLIYRDSVIVQADSRGQSFLAAFRLEDGEEIWRTARPDENPTWSTPVLFHSLQGPELITNSTRYLRGYDPSTGLELWRFLDPADVRVPTPVLDRERIYFSGGAPRGRRFFAVRAGGRGDVSATEPGPQSFLVWSVDQGGPYAPSPLLLDDVLYVLGDNGVLGSYDARTGERHYRVRVPELGASYSASPVAGGGHLFFASQDGGLHVVRAGTTFELVSSNDFGEPIMATPALSDTLLLVRGQHHLFAIQAGLR